MCPRVGVGPAVCVQVCRCPEHAFVGAGGCGRGAGCKLSCRGVLMVVVMRCRGRPRVCGSAVLATDAIYETCMMTESYQSSSPRPWVEPGTFRSSVWDPATELSRRLHLFRCNKNRCLGFPRVTHKHIHDHLCTNMPSYLYTCRFLCEATSCCIYVRPATCCTPCGARTHDLWLIRPSL